jgi:hypothetical protein
VGALLVPRGAAARGASERLPAAPRAGAVRSAAEPTLGSVGASAGTSA